jgi:hypothetical protein
MNRVIRLYIVKWHLTMRLLLMHVIMMTSKARSPRQIH